VQEILERDGWSSGNSIAFILEGEDQGASVVENAREFEAFENIADPEDTDPDGNPGDGQNHPERVPRLFIYYTLQAGSIEVPIVKTGTLDDEGTIIDVSTDDCEQENDAIDTPYDDDLDAGWEGEEGDANILTVGLRFQSLAIPQNAVIDSAYIKVWSHEGKSNADVAKITITGDATDNAVTFNETDLITDRPRTDASILWTVDEEWIIWEPYRTPDLSTIVQEIVDRDGWNAGNSIAFILQGEDQGASVVENAREFEAFENIADPEDTDPDGNPGDGQNHPERVPRLFVYFHGNVPTDINEVIAMDNSIQINAYPNPVEKGVLNINMESSDEARITLYDLTGKSVYSEFTRSKNNLIDVSELNSGLYILNVIQNNTSYNQRVIIK
jgi:hypothetical protein